MNEAKSEMQKFIIHLNGQQTDTKK